MSEWHDYLTPEDGQRLHDIETAMAAKMRDRGTFVPERELLKAEYADKRKIREACLQRARRARKKK